MTTNTSVQPIKVAVLGFGMSATVFHIPFILALPQYELVSIFERKATPEKSVAREAHPTIRVVNTLDQVLNDPEIELVFISTVNDTHFGSSESASQASGNSFRRNVWLTIEILTEYSKACLNAGKHVVVEKPLTPTSAEAWELAHLAAKQGLVLAVYQNRRWDGDFLTVKSLLSKGVLGNLSEFESHFDRFKNEAATTKLWKELALPGSGAAYDLGSHLVAFFQATLEKVLTFTHLQIDQILSIFGKPARVTGIVRNSRLIGNPDVEDSFLIHLHYEPEDTPGRKLPLIATARGTVLSLLAPQLRFSVKGTSGAFIKHGLDCQEDQLKAGGASAPPQSDFGVDPAALAGTLYTSKGSETVPTINGNYAAWFENVADAIRSKDRTKLIVTPEQAALTIEIVEAAIRSSREGRTITL
ncbi:hypothetical protein P7C70_g970, partial [Phenoliferia sp. Uapishka_3]